MTEVVSINNFKGGVSKTSSTAGIAYVLSEIKKKKVLVVDLDPQADVTDLLIKTFKENNNSLLNEVMNSDNIESILDEKEDEILDLLLRKSTDINENDLYHTLKEKKHLRKTIIELSNNLSIVPSDFNMIGYPYLLEDLKLNRIDGAKYFDSFLEEVKEDYDFILIDTPPTLSDFANSGIYSCDYSLIVVQTHVRSFNAVEKLISHLSDFRDLHDNDFDIVGVLPVMFKNQGKIDRFIIKLLKHVYGNYVFENKVMQRERVKFWDAIGIQNEDMHDRNVLTMYENIADELLEKMRDSNGK
ncbi:TPA: ParA family protein [Staphylococcus aureus]|uniref:Sporulation initiation inhibitor protein Soj n=1 Tax=Staphylococcus aureus TaxID=1280 RepID=A0A1B3ISU3_STAAU|nr:ParA family protein [Staphylococcus aureus]AOF44139.1 Sporulation initiation inhibitor protein Soj [Staphylococcus aureus]AXQ85918.1 ParA [Staphylococcus aureus]MBA8634142.1 ParA family protein [Staphylococcus aureus]HDJ5650353.1 ParA family protein [Staphylococcus aureus]HDJ5734390.1 ParA family protein [Staphylococcus aureus]